MQDGKIMVLTCIQFNMLVLVTLSWMWIWIVTDLFKHFSFATFWEH